MLAPRKQSLSGLKITNWNIYDLKGFEKRNLVAFL